MKSLYNLKEKMWNELDEYANKSNLSLGDVEVVCKLTEGIKNICKIDRMTSEMSGKSHTGGGMWSANGSYGSSMTGRSHNNGMSNTGSSYNYETSGRRMHYVQGHMSHDMEGKSAKEKMYHELSEASQYAENERQREVLNRAMRELENA